MKMRSLARRHPLAVFLAIAYGASAAIFALPLLSLAGIGIIDLDLPGVAPFVLLDTFALAGAAFITTALADGRSGVRELRRRVFNFRVNPGWYALAMLLLPVTAMATAIAIGGVDVLAAIVGDPVAVLATIVVASLLAFALVNLWEEAAWTGFALERLQPRLGPIGASVVTTWLQALVHVPLVFVVGGVTVGRVPPEQVPFYLVALFVLPIPVRMALTWLYNSSGRSVPIVGLAHAGLGVAAGVELIPVVAPAVDPVWVYAGFAVLAAVILVATRGRLGYEGGDRSILTGGEVAVAA